MSLKDAVVNYPYTISVKVPVTWTDKIKEMDLQLRCTRIGSQYHDFEIMWKAKPAAVLPLSVSTDSRILEGKLADEELETCAKRLWRFFSSHD